MISDYVLIIGAMKSGTTTLYNYLMRHPYVATGRWKEPGFFAFEEKWALGFDWYESQFDYDPSRHRYALDGSTDYTKHPFCKDVVERLKASAPRRFKLIYIMRHPLRRIESHARHVERTKREVGQCISPRASHSLDAGISPVSIAISQYAHQIESFSEYYERGELLLLTLERLAREPNAVYGQICKFLEIEALIPGDSANMSNTASSRTSAHPFRGSLYPVWATLGRIPSLRRAVRNVVPQVARAHLSRQAKMWARPEGRFLLNAEEEGAVIAKLAPDLRRLRDRYGIDAEKEWAIKLD